MSQFFGEDFEQLLISEKVSKDEKMFSDYSFSVLELPVCDSSPQLPDTRLVVTPASGYQKREIGSISLDFEFSYESPCCFARRRLFFKDHSLSKERKDNSMMYSVVHIGGDIVVSDTTNVSIKEQALIQSDNSSLISLSPYLTSTPSVVSSNISLETIDAQQEVSGITELSFSSPAFVVGDNFETTELSFAPPKLQSFSTTSLHSDDSLSMVQLEPFLHNEVTRTSQLKNIEDSQRQASNTLKQEITHMKKEIRMLVEERRQLYDQYVQYCVDEVRTMEEYAVYIKELDHVQRLTKRNIYSTKNDDTMREMNRICENMIYSIEEIFDYLLTNAIMEQTVNPVTTKFIKEKTYELLHSGRNRNFRRDNDMIRPKNRSSLITDDQLTEVIFQLICSGKLNDYYVKDDEVFLPESESKDEVVGAILKKVKRNTIIDIREHLSSLMRSLMVKTSESIFPYIKTRKVMFTTSELAPVEKILKVDLIQHGSGRHYQENNLLHKNPVT